MRRIVLVLLAIFGALWIATLSQARADEVTWSCPKGQFLTGFKGSSGIWNDNLKPLCSAWAADGLQGSVEPDALFGTRQMTRNGWKYETCGQDGAITALRYGLATPDDGPHLQNLQIQCTNVVTHITDPTWRSDLVIDGGPLGNNSQCDGAYTAAVSVAIGVRGDAITGLRINCVVVSQVMVDAAAVDAERVADAIARRPPVAVQGQDRPGFDITATAITPSNANSCYQRCANESLCVAWSFGHDWSATTYDKCHLKFRVTPPQADWGFVSGVMPPRDAAIRTDRPGSDIANFALSDTDPNLCAAACVANTQCKAWTYTVPGVHGVAGPHCYLKGAVPAAVRDSCCVSGTPIRLPKSIGALSKLGNQTTTTPPLTTTTRIPLSKLGNTLAQQKTSGPDDQTLSVSCTSTGEACGTPAAVNLPDGSWTVRVFAPATHCSPIQYRLTTDNRGDLIGNTGPLAPGAGSPPMTVPVTTRQIYISATGISGGCNTGTLSGWGVIVRLAPR